MPRELDNPAYPSFVANSERFVVGRAILNPAYYHSCGFTGDVFGDPKLGEVWDTVGEMLAGGSEVTDDTVCAALDKKGRLRWVGGAAVVHQLPLTDGAPLSAPDVIRNAWLLREARQLAVECDQLIQQGLAGDEVIGRLRGRLDDIAAQNGREVPTLAQAVSEELTSAEADRQVLAGGGRLNVGLPTGLGIERYVPGGIPRDKLTLLFGETGTFKTALKQNLIDAITLGVPDGLVLDFSLEDSIQLTTQRYLARLSGIPYGRIATREFEPGDLECIKRQLPRAEAAAKRVRVVGDVPGSIDEALRLVQTYKREGLVAVFLDYIQLISTEWDKIVEICQKMQRSAKVDRVAWIAVSQVKQQDIENREDHRPRLSDVYGGPGMRMCPKLAVGIYRPFKYAASPGNKSRYSEMYNNHPQGEEMYASVLELLIRKNVVGCDDATIPILVDRPTGLMREYDL